MSKNIRINKYFYIFTLCCLLISAHISAASEAFKNSLIRMDFAKISGGIQVKLYTNKSYSDSISVVKKSDSEYAILMPETSNSMTASPILNSVSSVVRGVSVKTQQYENGIKGYTKITISTTAPIEIVPQVKVINVSEYQLSENDYSELLTQTSKKQKPASTQKSKAKPTKAIQKTAYIPPNKIKKQEPKQTIVAAKPKQVAQKPIEKPIIKEVKKPVSQPVAQPVKQTVESAKLSQETKQAVTTEATTVPSPSPIAPPTQNALPAPEPIAQQPIAPPAPPLTFSQKLINVAENPRLLAKYKDVVMNNIYLIGGAAVITFLLLLLGARRMTKGIQKQKETFTQNLNESPAQTSNFMDKINENMTWKEKYQTYVEASNQPQEESIETPEQQTEPTPPSFEAQDELNELFEIESEDNFTPSEATETFENTAQENFTAQTTTNENIYEQLERDLLAETEVPQHEISGTEDVFGKDRLDEIFGLDENALGENILGEDMFGEENYSFNEPPQENIKPRASFYEPLNSEPIGEPSVEPFIEQFSEPFGETFAEPESFTEPATETFSAVDEEQEVEEIKSEYVIDDKRGFYLVNYKDSSALIGHIEDEVFVLKQFKEKIEGNLQARLDEHKGASANYMTKVGSKFKALVEVKPDDMNLLIEL